MTTPPAVSLDLEAASVPAGSAALAAAQQQPAVPATNKVAAQEEESPRLRSAFVRKIHGILSLQFALTAAVAATVGFVRPVHRFFSSGPPAAVWPAFAVVVASPLIAMFPLLEDREKQPTRNRVLLVLYALCCSFSVAMSACTTVADMMAVQQATILTVLGLTLLAIWGAKMGCDFTDTFPTLLTGLIASLVYIIVVIPFPLMMVGIAICGFLTTLVFWSLFVVICDLDDYDDDYYNGSNDGSDYEDDDCGSMEEACMQLCV